MAPKEDVGLVCAELLKGLDSDTLDYIAMGIVEDDGNVLACDEVVDFVSPLIAEPLCGGDEKKAAALAATLHARLAPAPAAFKPAPRPKAAALPQAVPMGVLLAAPKELKMDLLGNEKPEEDDDAKKGPKKETEAKSAKNEAKAGKDAKAQARKVEVARVEAEQLDKELDGAKAKAVKLRQTKGPFKGTIEIGPLTLPNPGGGLDLLADASFVMTPGRRYGLVGRNGKGKSTLLRYMAARRVGGMPDNVTVHYVSQEVAFGAAAMQQTPAEAVLEADVERRLLLEEAAALEGKTGPGEPERLSECLEMLEAIGASTAEERANQLLVNLGFSIELRARKLQALSGGWRVRVALAAALFAKPDVLLLDEPTNHLSIQAVMWLSHELANSPTWQSRIVVVVSHDRVFVDEACTDMLHISGVARKLTQSRGNYSMWAQRRSEQQKARERQLENEGAERDKLKEYTGHGYKFGGSSGQINMMQKMKKQLVKNEAKAELEEEELAALNEDADLPLQLLAGGVLDSHAVQLKEVAFGYPGSTEPLFKGAEFTIDGKSRIVLVGENGNGKTTLVKLILGELQPTGGSIDRNRGAKISLVNQHHADQIDLSLTPLQYMMRNFPGDGTNQHELAVRSHLAACGIDALQQNVTAACLSGGQRSRVAMSAVSYERPHVLVMDEPTNNLDLGSVEALAESVKNFNGGVVLVSHDQYFVSQVANEVWIVDKGKVKRAESFEAYRKGILASIKR
ncbi:unnamed protein product [Polarella glacialis]|uniref:ABC transporter domain-containing protein n=1 Tax=Polarella glacialis TaxID=89957 RepID=A0A813J5M7_POLGL|nr:unnamed protein product [Polarella glacialis]